MAEETQYTGNMAMITISTANPNLNGTGTTTTLITGTVTGTLIKTITIKAQGTTSQGMIRIFQFSHAIFHLIREIPVDAITQTGTNPTFERTVSLNFLLGAGDSLKVSTDQGNIFNIIAEALDLSYYAPTVRPDTTIAENFETGFCFVSIANSNLDGTGAITQFTSGTSGTKGAAIQSITVKAVDTTTAGMVRIFINNLISGDTKLFKEIPIQAFIPSPSSASFEQTVVFVDNFVLPFNFVFYASTQNAETFSITADGIGWNYMP